MLRLTRVDSRATADASDDLFGDGDLPNVALIGTSFSRNSNFLPFLEQALGASVGRFAKDGGHFAGAARDYFPSPRFDKPRHSYWSGKFPSAIYNPPAPRRYVSIRVLEATKGNSCRSEDATPGPQEAFR
ncbi:hypothetical protein AR540_06495 [Pseudomonas sp. EpS/L25]|nr:hypothetical protein AR540_06495 [Pseudomonas sp. EpS/L25]